MLYLKHFESTSNEYYSEVDSNFYQESLIDFDNRDMRLINKLAKNIRLNVDEISYGPRTQSKYIKVELYTPSTNKFAKALLVSITKSNNEYYICRYGGSIKIQNDFKSKTFNCDQIDGLIKNLKDALDGWEERWEERAFKKGKKNS